MVFNEYPIPVNITDRLQKLVNILSLNAGFIENPGLGKGKLGIAILFYSYARYSTNKWFEESADSLIDDIFEHINNSIALDFENGLIGIGWGISYLIRKGFLEGNIDEVLDEIDIAISDKLNEYLLEERINKKIESGYYLYIRAKSKTGDWDGSEIFSYINLRNSKMPLTVTSLIEPDNYGFFEGLAGEAFLILKNINSKR